MGLKEAFRKVGQAIEETKMKIGMKKYKKGGIQIEEKDQKPEMVIPVNDISLPEEKKKTEDAEIRKIEDLPAYEGSSIDRRKRRRQKDNKGRMVWQIWSRKRKRMKKPS